MHHHSPNDESLQAALLSLTERLTRDPSQSYGMTGVSVGVYPWHGTSITIHRGHDSTGMPLSDASVFCLASVGKLAIALLTLELVATDRATLRSTVEEFIPEASGEIRKATLSELLSHRSGARACLPQSEVPYNGQLSWARIESACLREDLPHRGEGVRYSDIAYGVLGSVVEHAWQRSLEDLLEERINKRLGTSLCLVPDDRVAFSGVVSVSHANAVELTTDLLPMSSAFWRRLKLPWGGVHGVLGDMQRLMLEFTPLGHILPDDLRQAAITDPDSGMLEGGLPSCGEHMGILGASPLQWNPCAWGLGPEIKGIKATHWTPREASPRSFGHVGTSGVLAWCDPDAQVSWTMAGTRGSYSGWLLRHGPALGRLAIGHMRVG